MRNRWARSAVNAAVAVGVLSTAFAFYAWTGPSDLAWMGGAETQRRVVQMELGAGPWDQPLFVLAAQPFLLLPWGNPPTRVQWASAAFAAGALLFVYFLLKMLLQMAPQFMARQVGVLAALSLGVSHTFWMRAVTPGTESIDALLLAATLYFLLRFANLGGTIHLYVGMGLLGLSLANNVLFVFLVPIVLIFVRAVQPPLVREIGKVRLKGLVAFALGSALAVATAVLGWLDGDTVARAELQGWIRFWDHMQLVWAPPLQKSLQQFGSMLVLNFPPWTALVALAGLWELYRRQKYVFFLLVPMFLAYGFVVVSMSLANPVPSYLPAWVLLSVAVGFGWWRILSVGGWQSFVLGLALCVSPLALYRYAPEAARRSKIELRVEALLDVAWELPVDHLALRLNPDRRGLPSAREFAADALAALPEGATVVTTTRSSELVVAPMRYLVEVENTAPVRFRALGDDGELEPNDYVMGLHPPHPAIERSFEAGDLEPQERWFRFVRNPSMAATASGADETQEALDDSDLIGVWQGRVEPQGYPLTLRVEGEPGALTATVRLNPEGRWQGQATFERIGSTLGVISGSVAYGDENAERVRIGIDGTQSGDRLEGTWTVYELPGLGGRFTVRKEAPPTPPPDIDPE